MLSPFFLTGGRNVDDPPPNNKEMRVWQTLYIHYLSIGYTNVIWGNQICQGSFQDILGDMANKEENPEYPKMTLGTLYSHSIITKCVFPD